MAERAQLNILDEPWSVQLEVQVPTMNDVMIGAVGVAIRRWNGSTTATAAGWR